MSGQRSGAALCLAILLWAAGTSADCPAQPGLQNYTGGGQLVCSCFVSGEQAGAVLNAPAADYPIEILRVGIGWASQSHGAPQSLEEAIHIYPAGLPNPGSPIFSLQGPVLSDGFINEFDLEPEPGTIELASGPFTVTLEFANANVGDPSAPSMVDDGNGCQAGKNVVFAVPGGWRDACQLGVSGDWVVYVIYRRVCATDVGDQHVLVNGPALLGPRPNPFGVGTEIEFVLDREEPGSLSVHDLGGRRVATLAQRVFGAGLHRVTWDGAIDGGGRASAGVYFVELSTPSFRATRKLFRMASGR